MDPCTHTAFQRFCFDQIDPERKVAGVALVYVEDANDMLAAKSRGRPGLA